MEVAQKMPGFFHPFTISLPHSKTGKAASKPAALQSFADFKTTTSSNPLFSENYENARKIPSGFDAVKTLYDQHAFQETDILTYNSRHYYQSCLQTLEGPNMIHLLRSRATQEQLTEMLEELTEYVKLAVDIRREVMTGGGELHADCEAVLLEDGSEQEDVWGADWWPSTKEVRYGSFINIRPGQNNPAMEILDPAIRDRVNVIVRSFFEGV